MSYNLPVQNYSTETIYNVMDKVDFLANVAYLRSSSSPAVEQVSAAVLLLPLRPTVPKCVKGAWQLWRLIDDVTGLYHQSSPREARRDCKGNQRRSQDCPEDWRNHSVRLYASASPNSSIQGDCSTKAGVEAIYEQIAKLTDRVDVLYVIRSGSS